MLVLTFVIIFLVIFIASQTDADHILISNSPKRHKADDSQNDAVPYSLSNIKQADLQNEVQSNENDGNENIIIQIQPNENLPNEFVLNDHSEIRKFSI